MLPKQMSTATYKAAINRFADQALKIGDPEQLITAHLLQTVGELIAMIEKLQNRVDALERAVKALQS